MILIRVELGRGADWDYTREDNELLTSAQRELILSELELLRSRMRVDGFLCCGVRLRVYPDGCHKIISDKWRNPESGFEFWTDRGQFKKQSKREAQ